MSEAKNRRPFVARIVLATFALFAGLLPVLPLTPVSPAYAVADTMTNAGSQPSAIECCGQDIFGSNNGSHVYAYRGAWEVTDIKVADNAVKNVAPQFEYGMAYAQTLDRSTTYFLGRGGMYILNSNTGVVSDLQPISDPDYLADNEDANPVDATVGLFDNGVDTPYNAIVLVDGGYSGVAPRILVIKLADLSVEAFTFSSIGITPTSDFSDGTIALDPSGYIYVASDIYNSVRGQVYKIPTATMSSPTIVQDSGGNDLKAMTLQFGRETGTTDLLYGRTNKDVFAIDTANSDAVDDLLQVGNEANIKGLDEADNGDIYLVESAYDGGTNTTNIVQLTKASNYAASRHTIIDRDENPVGVVYQKDSAGNECLYTHFNGEEVVRAVAINSSKCGVFRTSRFGGGTSNLAINDSRTITIDRTFGAGVGDDSAWDSYAIFLDGKVVGAASGSIPSSISVDWADYNTGISFEVRGYTAGSRGATAIADIDYSTRFVDNLAFRLDYYPLAATEISTGESHTCAIADGSVLCWGYDYDGGLGNGSDVNDGSSDSSAIPVKVVEAGDFTNENVTAIAAGDAFTCAIEGEVVYCWGDNGDGKLGDGTTDTSSIPVKVANVPGGFSNSGVTAIDAYSDHICAIKAGVVYCWGNNSDGQLGDGTDQNSSTPVRVGNGTDGFSNTAVTDVSVGGGHSCAVKGGSVFCWGDNGDGQLGNKDDTTSFDPVKVHDAPSGDGDFVNSGVTDVDGGEEFNCAISSGKVYCWGDGDYYQMGNNTSSDSDFPVLVEPTGDFLNTSVTAVSAGYQDACAIEGGKVYCWGDNGDSHGDGDDTSAQVPEKALDNGEIFQNADVTLVSQGSGFTCVVADGGAYCSGDGNDGQLGNGVFEADSELFDMVFGGLAPNDGGGNDVIPGVTETDSTFYENRLPAQVAKLSSMKVLRPASLRTKKLVSKTTGVCLAGKNQVLYLKAGRCRVQIIKKSNKAVLKTLTTRVTNRTVSQIGKGNQAAMVKKVMFNWKSKNPKGMTPRKWRNLKTSVGRTGLIFVVGHTRRGVGPTTKPKFAMARANVVKKKVTKRGLTIELFGMGSKHPIARGTAKRQQMKNERVMIYMIATRRAST